MLKAFVGRFARDTVQGWAVDTTRPDAALSISIYVNGQHVGDTLADVARPDLARLADFGQGRHGLHFRFATKLPADSLQVLTLCLAETHAPLPGGERVLAADTTPAPLHDMTPILVTGPGRTGTTLLMSLLANSADIVVAELMPYETRHLAYYAIADAVLTHPADIVRSTHHDNVRGDGFRVGFNPYQCPAHEAAFRNPALARDFALNYAPSRLASTFGDLVAEYYRRLKRDTGKPAARYFAEKNDNLQPSVRRFARRAFGEVREIVTVRDPRDVLCSSLAYFKKLEPERAFTDISYASKTALAIFAERLPDVFFCKYERLLQGEQAFLDELSAFLGARVTPRPAEMRADMFRKHGTSASPDATLERWRTDLPSGMLARCNEAWAPYLETFGYPVD